MDRGTTVGMVTKSKERIASSARPVTSCNDGVRDNGELTPDHAVVSAEQQRAASSADDHDEILTVSGEVPPDSPARHKGTFAMLAAVACTVFGAKLITISALGS